MPTANPLPASLPLLPTHHDSNMESTHIHPHQKQQQQQQQQEQQEKEHEQQTSHPHQTWRSNLTPSPPPSHSHQQQQHSYYQQQFQDRLKKDGAEQHHHHHTHTRYYQQQHPHRDRSEESYHQHSHHERHYYNNSSTYPQSPSSSYNNSVSSHSPYAVDHYRYMSEANSNGHHHHSSADSQQSMHAADTLLMLSAAAFMDQAEVDSVLQQRDRRSSNDAADLAGRGQSTYARDSEDVIHSSSHAHSRRSNQARDSTTPHQYHQHQRQHQHQQQHQHQHQHQAHNNHHSHQQYSQEHRQGSHLTNQSDYSSKPLPPSNQINAYTESSDRSMSIMHTSASTPTPGSPSRGNRLGGATERGRGSPENHHSMNPLEPAREAGSDKTGSSRRDSDHGQEQNEQEKEKQGEQRKVGKVQVEDHDEDDDEEEEEEDEVMSEGVVNVKSNLKPFALSPGSKTRSEIHAQNTQGYFHGVNPHQYARASSYAAGHGHQPVPAPISISASPMSKDQSQSQPGSPTKTQPMSRTRSRPSRSASAAARARNRAKRSQSESANGLGASNVNGYSIGTGKNSFGDASSQPFLFSPFPASCSPTSSSGPLSPLSFHAQLQMLTHNFVSIQPHSSPTNRFKRMPSALTTGIVSSPPFSPPVSPGRDHTREGSVNPPSLGSASTSPTKQHGTSSSTNGRGSGSALTPRAHFKPRWHTQPYMMFLALRAIPQRTAARQELIMAAVELDKKFSAEKNLPRVFTGKTPMNSASACLTNNGDKYFIPFKPEGSRSTHFRLAYEPCDFETARREYDHWMEKLISQDWPLCFGVPKDDIISSQQPSRRGSADMDVQYDQEPLPSPMGTKRRGQKLDTQDSLLKKPKAEEDGESLATPTQTQNQDELRFFDKLEKMGIHSAPSTPCTTAPPVLYTNEGPAFDTKYKVGSSYHLDDLDLSKVPSRLDDMVRVDASKIPNAGNGLFAKIDIPASTPLGFYFGVPMTENEFDSLKDGVGYASQYTLMYRRTVLDATDENGMPYSDPKNRFFCPFHFMNEDPNGNVSFITGSVDNQIVCTSNRDIKAGEELLVYYGKETDRHWPVSQAPPTPGTVAPQPASPTGGSQQENGTMDVSSDSHTCSTSRTASPTRRGGDEGTNRPRRETVYKPARYTR
ncbi:hypothetical protein BGZ94_007286 [Podila epigama]|nr:hypothetical protein BGZ94_007286 [Podila epigama]